MVIVEAPLVSRFRRAAAAGFSDPWALACRGTGALGQQPGWREKNTLSTHSSGPGRAGGGTSDSVSYIRVFYE